jgi:osmotically-inducible protein OsmY
MLMTNVQSMLRNLTSVWSGDCQIEGMRNDSLRRISRIGCATLLFTLCALAQQHKWAGRTLDEFEWRIHETLASLPHSAFDTVNFEAQGKTVTLSGQVVKASVKRNAETAVGRLGGVEKVVNHIEVLPSSRRDDALRMNVYRALYEKQPLEKYGVRHAPPIHIIVKDGWVTLEGVVDSDADRSAAHLQALKVTSHVSDNLRVAAQDYE